MMCGEVEDRVCPTLPVRVYQKHEAGHSEGVLSEEGYHNSLV